MSNEFRTFENPEFGAIRTVIVDGDPWFVGNDVARSLGYTDVRHAVPHHVDEDDKLRVQIEHAGQMRDVTVINESGVYSLAFGSKLDNAKQFKRWITTEVLPSIRKHGAYMTPETIEAAICNPDYLIKIATILKEEQERRKALETENLALTEQVEEAKPKVLFADSVSASDNTILIGDLAKLLKQNGMDIGQNRLFELLRQEGFLVKTGSRRNMPTQRAMESGLFRVKERTVNNPDGTIRTTMTTKVTGKGQQFFVTRYLKLNERKD